MVAVELRRMSLLKVLPEDMPESVLLLLALGLDSPDAISELEVEKGPRAVTKLSRSSSDDSLTAECASRAVAGSDRVLIEGERVGCVAL